MRPQPVIGVSPRLEVEPNPSTFGVMSQESFTVMYHTNPPSPSWSAYKQRTKGTLTVSEDSAIFKPKSGDPIVIDHVQKLTKGWKGSTHGTPMLSLVDTYVEVIYGDKDAPSVAFFNDPRWLGLASYLPHRSLV